MKNFNLKRIIADAKLTFTGVMVVLASFTTLTTQTSCNKNSIIDEEIISVKKVENLSFDKPISLVDYNSSIAKTAAKFNENGRKSHPDDIINVSFTGNGRIVANNIQELQAVAEHTKAPLVNLLGGSIPLEANAKVVSSDDIAAPLANVNSDLFELVGGNVSVSDLISLSTLFSLKASGVNVNISDNVAILTKDQTISKADMEQFIAEYGEGYAFAEPGEIPGELRTEEANLMNIETLYNYVMQEGVTYLDGKGSVSVDAKINTAFPEVWVRATLDTYPTKVEGVAWLYEGSTKEKPDTAFYNNTYYPSQQEKKKKEASAEYNGKPVNKKKIVKQQNTMLLNGNRNKSHQMKQVHQNKIVNRR